MASDRPHSPWLLTVVRGRLAASGRNVTSGSWFPSQRQVLLFSTGEKATCDGADIAPAGCFKSDVRCLSRDIWRCLMTGRTFLITSWQDETSHLVSLCQCADWPNFVFTSAARCFSAWERMRGGDNKNLCQHFPVKREPNVETMSRHVSVQRSSDRTNYREPDITGSRAHYVEPAGPEGRYGRDYLMIFSSIYITINPRDSNTNSRGWPPPTRQIFLHVDFIRNNENVARDNVMLDTR